MSNTNVVRTAAAGLIQTRQKYGQPHMLDDYTTMNQKLGIFSTAEPAVDDQLSEAYVVIGNGGHSFVVGSNGKVKYDGKMHKPTHTAPFATVPFVLRLLNDDLQPSERLNYRLRKIETYGGEQYVAYYARKLDLSTVNVVRELRHVEDGITTASPYVPTIEDMNPLPTALSVGSAVTTTGDYIATTAKIIFTMSPAEVQEFLQAIQVIEADTGFAIISELCTVAGVDRQVTGTFNGVQQTYDEVIAAQITSFVATAYIMQFQTTGIEITLDVGVVEPLLTVTAS